MYVGMGSRIFYWPFFAASLSYIYPLPKYCNTVPEDIRSMENVLQKVSFKNIFFQTEFRSEIFYFKIQIKIKMKG